MTSEKEPLASCKTGERQGDEVNDYRTASTTDDARRESAYAIQYHDRGTIFASWRALSELLNMKTTSSEMSRYASGEQFRNASGLLIKVLEPLRGGSCTFFIRRKRNTERAIRGRTALFAVSGASHLRPFLQFSLLTQKTAEKAARQKR
jgi:hypothetical protein